MEKLKNMKDVTHNMRLLILCPGSIASSVDNIKCFTDVLNYYLPRSLSSLNDVTVKTCTIPADDGDALKEVYSTIEVENFDAILTLGLRFYSKISKETTDLLRQRFSGILCQVHDGTRLDYDPVDITFTFKDDDTRLSESAKRLERHQQYNSYMGWATDFGLNKPQQDPNTLRILVDHTNYGDNPVDLTEKILLEIKQFVDSDLWKSQYQSVMVRRFDSGKVIDVDFDDTAIARYDRTSIPFSEITKEHCAAHVFCVTHPESVGLVVLETAAAGALPVVPRGFVPQDRLDTVRHLEWTDHIDWQQVLDNIDISASREVAMKNNWHSVSTRIITELKTRLGDQS